MKDLITSILMLIIFTLILGIAYPFAVWGVSQAVFSHKANGSLIANEEGEVIGSELIGQNFTSPGYFQGRPSAAGSGYDAGASSGSNLGPTSRKLIDRITADSKSLSAGNPTYAIPADLVTASGSGLDPHISTAAAEFQIPRVARERGIDEGRVREIVEARTEGRQFAFFGEPRVNVLMLNLEIDRRFGRSVK